MCSCSLVCTLYAVCMHPQLHTFTAPQPYGHAYSRFCMHCMQSIPELGLRIERIVGFLMHTMHTSRMSWQFAMIAERGGDPNLDKQAMRLDRRFGRSDGIRTCLKTRTVEDIRTGGIKRSRRGILSFPSFYVLICILYALCMRSQLHTFSASQPYGHAYLRFCMHCMQSIPELCLRIACIGAFLMHTMHTTFRSSTQATKPTKPMERTDCVYARRSAR